MQLSSALNTLERCSHRGRPSPNRRVGSTHSLFRLSRSSTFCYTMYIKYHFGGPPLASSSLSAWLVVIFLNGRQRHHHHHHQANGFDKGIEEEEKKSPARRAKQLAFFISRFDSSLKIRASRPTFFFL